MLRSCSRWHFASDSSPEREHRMARFAKDDTRKPNNEAEQRVSAGSNEGNTGASTSVSEAQQRTGGLVRTAALPILAEQTAKEVAGSPFLLYEIERSHIAAHPEIQEIFTAQREKPTEKTPQDLQDVIERALDHPNHAFLLAKICRKRLDLYRDLLRRMQGMNRDKLGVTEEQLILHEAEATRWIEGMDEKQLEEAAADFGVSPAKDPLADRIIAELKAEGKLENDADNTSNIFRGALRGAFSGLKRLLMFQKMDTGSALETREEFSEETLSKLEKQARALEEHIDAQLQAKAHALEGLYKGRVEALRGAVDETTLHGVMAELTQDLDLIRTAARMPSELPPGMSGDGLTVTNAPPIGSDKFLPYAEDAWLRLSELERQWKTQEHFEATYMERAKGEHAEGNAFLRGNTDALRTGMRSERFRSFVSKIAGAKEALDAMDGFGALLEKIANGTATSEERQEYTWIVSQMTTAQKEILQPIFDAAEDPEYLDLLMRRQEQLERISIDTPANVEQRLKNVEEALFPGNTLASALEHPVSRILGVEQALRNSISSIHARTRELHDEKGNPMGTFQVENDVLRSALSDLQSLEQCIADLVQKQPAIISCQDDREFRNFAKTDGIAVYKPEQDAIFVNEEKARSGGGSRERAIEHERGHRISLYFTRKSGLVPKSPYSAFRETITNDDGSEVTFTIDGKTVTPWELLEDVAARIWGSEGKLDFYVQKARAEHSDRNPEELGRLLYRKALCDELLNQYATWCTDGKPQRHDDAEMRLLRLMDGEGVKDEKPEELFHMANHATLGSDHDEDEPGTPRAAAPAVGAIRDINQKFLDINRQFTVIRNFVDGHPQFKKQIDEELPAMERAYARIRDAQRRDVQYNPSHQLEPIEHNLGIIIKGIEAFQARELDLSSVAAGRKRGFRAIFDYVDFMSINDFLGMFKDGWEDIKRLWERRGVSVKSHFGELLTGWIPNQVPYAGYLKHEFRRRAHQKELDEIEQWKKAFENASSYSIQETITHTRNRDQVRALIELLVHRGRMDWNDENVWRTLADLSHFGGEFRKNFSACRNNDVLRDRWLHRVIANIWEDNDMFFNWKRQNDSEYKSGMDKFSATVDQLSNVKSGMKNALARILELFHRHRHHPESIPEEVDPHLYEKLIFYAIENGKLSMEDKFFYIGQGIDMGLLSIDRLRVLAGEGGGILLVFPFIDYFYNKNNSMPEIRAFAKKLREAEPPNKQAFEPGKKTTVFVHLVIAREQRVKERLRKGVDRLAEKMDHEDVHYYAANLDYGGINTLLSTFSGRRQKTTKEGLKNMYVAFSNKLMAFALLAKLHGKGLTFGEEDARDLIQTIVSYAHMDNIVTRNGYENEDRPELSPNEYQLTPVAGKRIVGDYRKSLNAFLMQVLHQYNEEIDWKKVNSGVRAEKDEDKINVENYAAQSIPPMRNKELVVNTFHATKYILSDLTEAVRRNPEALIKLLQENAGNIIAEDFEEPDASMEAIRNYFGM